MGRIISEILIGVASLSVIASMNGCNADMEKAALGAYKKGMPNYGQYTRQLFSESKKRQK